MSATPLASILVLFAILALVLGGSLWLATHLERAELRAIELRAAERAAAREQLQAAVASKRSEPKPPRLYAVPGGWAASVLDPDTEANIRASARTATPAVRADTLAWLEAEIARARSAAAAAESKRSDGGVR
jgi:hypothetical protein